MEDNEFEALKNNDKYLVERQRPSVADEQLYLKEVDFTCPLCGADLRNHKQTKQNKLYEIAHIYPNSPTKEQYENLIDIERLGNNSESFENKIALCKNCHDNQDYHTNKNDYKKLLNIKKDCLIKTRLLESTFSIGLEKEIAYVVEKIVDIDEEIISELNDFPVKVKNKFYPSERILKDKVSILITQNYPYVLELFKNLDGFNDFSFTSLCLRIKSCYEKMKVITNDKEYIFNEIVDWIMKHTESKSQVACEVVVSFFIQNCEVFDEITE